MKKNLLLLILIITISIVLFIFLQEKREVKKEPKKVPQKINKVIKNTPAVKTIKKEKIPKKKKDINLNPEIIEEKYQLTDKYDEPLPLPNEGIKKEDSQLNLDANVKKEKKDIDS
jgi:hypothetical protein